MGWDFKVDFIAKEIAKAEALAEKFDAMVAGPLMTIAELKAKFSDPRVLRAEIAAKVPREQMQVPVP